MDIKGSIDNLTVGMDKAKVLSDEFKAMRERAEDILNPSRLEFILFDDDEMFCKIFEKILRKEAKLADIKIKLKVIRTPGGVNTFPRSELENSILFVDIFMGTLVGPEVLNLLNTPPLSKVFFVSAEKNFSSDIQSDIDHHGHELVEKDNDMIKAKIQEVLKAYQAV